MKNITNTFKRRKIFYGWYLIPVVGFLNTLTGVPIFHGMGLWFVALESAFGWNRTQLALAFSLTRIEGGILGPVEGYLADRIGTRRLVFIGLTIMGIGFILLGQVRNLWMFYLAFLIMALGQGLGGWLPLNALITNWFIKYRTTAMGWANSIGRLGGLIFIPALAWGVDPTADNLGFRATATIIGVFSILIAFPISRAIRNRPEELGLDPDGISSKDSPTNSSSNYVNSIDSNLDTVSDFTVKEALQTRAFWFISIGHGLTAMLIIGMMAHLAPMLTDRGFSVQTAGFVVTSYTATSMIFQIIGGYLGDRLPKRILLFLFTSIQAISVFYLILSPPTISAAYVFGIVFGLGFGGRAPLSVSIRGEYFGRRNFGTIMGISQIPMNILLLFAPIMAGIMYDLQGTYNVAFAILALLNFTGGLFFLLARKPIRPI